jgi:hypothetical protein
LTSSKSGLYQVLVTPACDPTWEAEIGRQVDGSSSIWAKKKKGMKIHLRKWKGMEVGKLGMVWHACHPRDARKG